MEFLLSMEVLGLLIVVVVFLLGFVGTKWINKLRLVFKIWHYIEKFSLLNGLQGYAKLGWAMNEFKKRFYATYGKEPSPGDEGWAVKILTWLCKLEDKEPIEDFFEESEPIES